MAGYFPDGKGQHFEIQRKDGLPHGKNRIWNENGILETEENNFNGKPDGWQRSWFENGKISGEQYYLGDQLIYDRAWNQNGAIVRDSMISMYPLIAATMAYLDSTKSLLQEFYNGKTPDDKPQFWPSDAGKDDGTIATFRNYHGLVELYHLDNSSFLANLTGPIPSSCHLILLKENSGIYQVTHDFQYYDRMASESGKPQLEIAKFIDQRQNCALLRTTDGVMCRSSESLTVLREKNDSLQIILWVRELSKEGPCYRIEHPNDSVYYDIVRTWQLLDQDSDGINEIYVSGTVANENTPAKVAVHFEEVWTWDDSLQHYETQTPFGLEVDSSGKIAKMKQ